MNNDTRQFHHKLVQCAVLIYQKDANPRMTLVYASLIPLVIDPKLLSNFEIIKRKRKKLTSSEIPFLTLFVSDLTIVVFNYEFRFAWHGKQVIKLVSKLNWVDFHDISAMAGRYHFVFHINQPPNPCCT